MTTMRSPIVSEFETAEQESEHTLWMREKVTASLTDSARPVSHDEVMTETTQLIESLRQRRSAS